MRLAACSIAIALAGCAEQPWQKSEHVQQVQVRKIESQLAVDFCSALLGSPKKGCSFRARNGDTGKHECVVVTLPNDAGVVAHEGAHCLGYDH